MTHGALCYASLVCHCGRTGRKKGREGKDGKGRTGREGREGKGKGKGRKRKDMQRKNLWSFLTFESIHQEGGIGWDDHDPQPFWLKLDS